MPSHPHTVTFYREQAATGSTENRFGSPSSVEEVALYEGPAHVVRDYRERLSSEGDRVVLGTHRVRVPRYALDVMSALEVGVRARTQYGEGRVTELHPADNAVSIKTEQT